jgi:energy-coupling factor transporter ATP-binding protein EcfA2
VSTRSAEIETWFQTRPKWLQDAARRILQSGQLGKKDVEELVAFCKAEVGIIDPAYKDLKPIGIANGALSGSQNQSTLRLVEISELKGVNALQPRMALEFGDKPLTIVYGQNGSGKSGYVRVLKHASGARRPGVLHGNIFSAAPDQQSCKFKCVIDGAPKDYDWAPSTGTVEELKPIQIYDTDCARVYISEENEVAFEPYLLRLFTDLTDLCVLVNNRLESEIQAKPTKEPAFPIELQTSKAASWYAKLSHNTTSHELQEKSAWTDELNAELEKLNKRLAETKPIQKAVGLRRQKTQLLAFYNELDQWNDKLSDLHCLSCLTVRDEARSKRHAAEVDAHKVFSNAPLSGVGTESWKLLWEQARAYSETEGYKGILFPNTAEDAKCVLCQQPLGVDARDRFKSFESFVKGGLETQAVEEEERAKTLFESLRGIGSDDLKLRMDSVGVADDSERSVIEVFRSELERRRSALVSAKDATGLPPAPEMDRIKFLSDRALQFEQQALAFDEDAKGENRPALESQRKELEAQKWLSQQLASIELEIDRLREVQKLEEARKLTSTQGLSTKKSTLADDLITLAYVNRFQTELAALNAPHIQVRLVKTRAEKGHVYHRIILHNSKKSVPTLEILSEGEFRIVSLAAFVADVEAREDKGPLVFDDPISSLDQVFEEATVERLVELSKTTQLIVFTHRLSLMTLLEEMAEKSNVDVGIVSLRTENWGVGEPSETPIHAKKPRAALNDLIGRVQRAQKVLGQSSAEYEMHAKAICSDFRIIIERLIENDLLSDVVQRFRRSIITKNKIHELSKIAAADCQYFDDLMTKYSKYEHSQPPEAPVSLPQPEELEKDIKKALAWVDEFKKR